MKKTWKCWLGTVAAAMLGGTAMAQAPDMDFGSEGAVRLGAPSGSATTSYAPGSINTYEPLDADAVWAEAPRAYQGAPPPGDESVGFASSASYNDTQWRVGRVNSNLYGFNGGYTSIGAFIPLSTDGQNMWFFDPRAIITDYGQGAANLGLGYRRYSYAMDRIFGASIWYDYDNGHRTDYSQIGLSLENIGRYFSTRFNANVPLSDSNDFTTAASFGTPFFQGNNIAYLYSFLREMPYQNYVAEAAAPVPFFGRYGWEWAISAYGLVANDSGARDAIGIGGRFEWQVSEDFWINTTITHDRIFSTNASVNFELTIPSGPQVRWLRPKRVHDKLLASVKRPYRVSTSTTGFSETRLFLDPNDGAPIQVAHIDPTAANGAASGSVTNPFGSIQDYMNLAAADRGNFDIIFVGGNTIATNDNDLNTTIELLDRQRLLGTGALADGGVHQFQALNPGNGQTVFNLPGFANGTSNTGPNPFLTNSGAAGDPVVRINGNYTEVSGFTIDAGGTANGIATVDSALAPRTVDSFAITNNTIQNAVTAINILSDTTPGATGPTTLPPARSLGSNDNVGNISNNTINGTIGTGVTDGVVVTHSAGTLDLRVASNTVNGVTDTGITLEATGGTINAFDGSLGLLNNTISATGTGALVHANGGDILMDVQGNSVTGSTTAIDPLDPTVGAGLAFVSEAGSDLTLGTFINNTLTGNAGNGASFTALAGSSLNIADQNGGGATVFNNNTLTGNTGNGALFSADGAGAVLNVTDVTTSTITGNTLNGLSFLASNGGQMTVGDALNGLAITGNTITGNTLDGISGVADGTGSLLDILIGSTDPQFAANTITGNGANGIDLSAVDGGTVQGAIQANVISQNTLNGIAISAIGTSSVANFNDLANGRLISDNIIGVTTGLTGNGQAGVLISVDSTDPAPGPAASALLQRNLIAGNGNLGVAAVGTGNGSGTIDLDIGGTDPLTMGNEITGNVDANVAVILAGNSSADVVIQSNLITDSVNGGNVNFEGEGIGFRVTDTATLTSALVIGNEITGNAGDGIDLLANTNSQVGDPVTPGLVIQSNVINTNGSDGIDLRRDGDAIVNVLIGTDTGTGDPLLGNSITDNVANGINIVTGGGDAGGATGTLVTAGQNFIAGNSTTGAGSGVNIVTNDTSTTRVDLLANDIAGASTTGGTVTQDNGISITTNNSSYFGTPGGPDSLFDGNVITGHSGDGINITRTGISNVHVDVYGNIRQSQITRNANGVVLNDFGGGAIFDVTIGDPASITAVQGANTAPGRPNVLIAENTNDAIQINQPGAGGLTLNVNNVLAVGQNQIAGGTSRNGLSYNVGGTVSNGDATINIDNSTFTDFGNDGMEMFFNAGDGSGASLLVDVRDSIIGQSQLSSNGGDGVDIEVRDSGASFTFENNLIQGNGGDGFRLETQAEFLQGSLYATAPNYDLNNSGQNETTGPDAPGLNAQADYRGTWGDINAIDLTTNIVFRNNVVNFNGDDGVDLAIGGGTSIGTAGNYAIFGGNTMAGNANSGFLTRTLTNPNVNVSTANINNQGENLPDIVRLDPMAHLYLNFGADGEAPNSGNNLNPTVTGGFYTVGDVFKPANRPILTDFNVRTNNANNFTFVGNPIPEFNVFQAGWGQQFIYTLPNGALSAYPYNYPVDGIINTP